MQSYSTLKSKDTTATISGLKPATRYIFQVRARTSAGCGRFSQTVEVETGKPGECMQLWDAGSVGQGAWGVAMPLSAAIVPQPRRERCWRQMPWGFSPQGLLEVALLRCVYTLERRERKDVTVRAGKTW